MADNKSDPSIQLPWARLRAPGAEPEPAVLPVELRTSAHSAAEYATAVLLQLVRYGNRTPAVQVFYGNRPNTDSGVSIVGGFDSNVLTTAECIARVQAQLNGDLSIDGSATHAFSICIVERPEAFDLACHDGLEALRSMRESFRLVISTNTSRAALVYDVSSLDESTVVRMAAHWLTLVHSLAPHASLPAAALDMLPQDEQTRIAVAGTGLRLQQPYADFVERFESTVHTHGSRTAVIYGERHISYSQLDALSRRIARHLQAAGARSGDKIAICLEPGPYSAACILGILRIRAVYVPIDPFYPAVRIGTMLSDSEAVLVVTGTNHISNISAIAGLVLDVEKLIQADTDDDTNTQMEPAAPDDAAYVFYTSGTTGIPKGIQASRANLAQYVGSAIQRYDINADDIIPCLARATFSISLFEILAPLACGASSIVLDRDHILDAPRLATTLQSVTLFHAGPNLLKNLLAHMEARESPTYRFPRLRHASSGGDLIPPEVLVRLRSVFAPAEIFVVYGCSEISVMGCTWEVPASGPITRTFVGVPFYDTEVRVLDSQQRSVPLGIPGEVHFSGPGVIPGYLNRPELNAKQFIEIDGRRFYNTGDVGRILDNGLLQLLGRLDFQVQLRGMRVELGEVEFVLRQCPSVLDSVVVARPGVDSELQLVAYYVSRKEDLSAADLRAWCLARLPDYMVPTVYVPLDGLPLNANLKVDRNALPDPASVLRRSSSAADAKRSPTEFRLAAIWHDVLGVKNATPDDDFFLLGGSSLGVMRVITRVAAEFGVQVAASEMFHDATLRRLAQRIDERSGKHTAPSLIPRLTDTARHQRHLLSAAQERMWFWSEMAPGTAIYNVPIMVSIDGPVRLDRLQSALDALIERQEILRGTWYVDDERPMQRIATRAAWPLRVVHTRTESQPAGRSESWALAEAEALRPINPLQELPVRALLIQSGSTSALLLLTLHHSVCDGWSTELVLRDLFAYYESPETDALPALPIQYLDYAAWESDWLSQGVRKSDIHYWTKKLAGVPGVVDLPLDHPRPAIQRYRGALLDISFSTADVSTLRLLAQRTGTTLFMVLLAAWQMLLHRLSRQSVIVTGSVIANRGRSEVDNLVGYFANSAALRADFLDGMTVADLIAQLRSTALEAYDHQAVPFEEVVDALKLPRDASRMPLIQTFLELQPPTETLPSLRELRIERQMLGTPVAKFDLSLELQETGTELRGYFEYDIDLFDSATIARWKEYLHVLVRGMCANEHQVLAALPILPESERHAHLVTWNATAKPYDNDVPVFRKFEQQAARNASALAVIFENTTLTYGALNARANQVARHIELLGGGCDVPVGVFMERSLELVVAIVAIHKAGAVYVPLDPDLPSDRVSFMVSDCGLTLILTQTHLLDRLQPNVVDQAVLVPLDQANSAIQMYSTANGTQESAPTDLAYIIYTSGSTGRPKGVEIPHLGLTNHVNWMEETISFSRTDRYLQKTTISFDAAVADFWLPLQAGACIVLAQPGGHKDLPYLLELIQQEQVTVTQFVPSSLRVLVDEPELALCASLRFLIVGGEALDWDTARAVQRVLRNLEIGNFYGPSEASDDSTYFPVRRGGLDSGIIPIGTPIANVQCYVLDEVRQLAPIGVAGELHVAGAGLARGYRNRTDLTAERFVTSPLLPGVRLYHTGDIVRRNSAGLIAFLGRADHQIKLRGFRIELDEIESAVRTAANPRQCAVIARQQSSGDHIIVAYLVDSNLSDDALRRALLARLPEYMVPSAFVAIDELPALLNGKLNRHALPEPTSYRAAQTLMAPSSETESLVCRVFRESLKRETISITDNFFDLGGHSLMAGRIISRLRTETGLALPLRTLFEHPTVKGLATVIDVSRWSERQSTSNSPRSDQANREEFEL
jgi:surfactin family lipopeptide synthetase A